MDAVALSVIVSVRNSASTLRDSLAAIRASLVPFSYELIVVDDASEDDSVPIAARYADTVVRLSGRMAGQGYARNRGVELARGGIVAFVDADVALKPDTLAKMVAILNSRPDVAAVSGSHTERCAQTNFVSQYFNLLVRFGEEAYSGRCAQFASGCGAVRREAFLGAGMYDEWRFPVSCMESIELGARLLHAGYEVILDDQLTATDLKRRNLLTMSREIWNRGRILARSLGYGRISTAAPSDIVFTLSRRLPPAIAVGGTLMLAAAFVPQPHFLTKTALGVGVLLLTSLPVHRYYAGSRGLAFSILAAPLHIFAQLVTGVALCTGWVLRDLFGDHSPDAVTQAYSEVGLEIWPPIPRKR
ncbi:MAG TPA: glycosyltransferase family 2 protein [Gemmatimonadaceae bacterium]|nr:glycosyltransferase family 2 protein [Gemmatimonadaceae bacterium]